MSTASKFISNEEHQGRPPASDGYRADYNYLLRAIIIGDIDMVQKSLEDPFWIKAFNNDGTNWFSIFAVVTARACPEITKSFLTNGRVPNVPSFRFILGPLLSAINLDCVDALRDMLNRPRVLSVFGPELLNYTITSGRVDAAKIIIEEGVDIESASGVTCDIPLHYAASLGNRFMVEMLLEKGADHTRQGPRYADVIQAARQNGHYELDKYLGFNVGRLATFEL